MFGKFAMKHKKMIFFSFYKRFLVNTITFFSSVFLFSCGTPEKSTNQNDVTREQVKLLKKYEEIARDKFSNDDLIYIPNLNNTLMLCLSHIKPTSENPFPSFNFFVYDLEKEEIIYEDSQENGNINCKNNEKLIIHIFPGQIRSENDKPIIYIYDIKKKKKFIDEIIEEK